MELVNGVESAALSVRDRGLAYGDGVFRTLPLVAGRAPHWARHYAKLASDCSALGIPSPSRADLEADLARVAAREPECAVKIIVTRGGGGRGYAPPAAASPTRIVMSQPLPARSPEWRRDGVRVRVCATRAGHQPRLAGIKHLNRLENVLARAEWTDPGVAEGLMLDAGGNVIEGTMSNIFIVEHGRLVTPALDASGVAGVQRERVIESAAAAGAAVQIALIPLARLLAADEIFLVNSLLPLWPVCAVDNRSFPVGAVAGRVLGWLDDDETA
jgi:4-amino-4-deoxychorismate lyase